MKRASLCVRWITCLACLTCLAVPTGARAQAAQPKGAPTTRPAPSQDLVAKGQALFDDQQYEESIQTLSAALLSPSNTKAQRVEIYRLLALNYITLGRKDEAESAVRGLLVQQPDHQLPAGESPRFRDFFAQVRQKWESEGRPGLEDPKDKPTGPAVTLRHQSPPQVAPDKGVTLRGQIVDPSGKASSVRVYYRTGTSGDFSDADAQVDDKGNVRAEIPGSAVRPPIVEYYLVALDASGGAVGTRGDAQTPLRIAVAEPTRGWLLPVAIGGGVLGAVAIVGGLALAGVFKGSSPSNGGGGRGPSTVSISVGEAGFRFR
jgi:tetratricopeptide (TPR) repeat protein